MVENGKFGSHTKTGARWEGKVSLESFFQTLKGYKVETYGEIHPKFAFKVYFQEQDKPVGYIFRQNAIYAYLKEEYGVEYRQVVSKKLLPDNSLYVLATNTFFIIECKTQKTPGSVDEKLQTCDFKLKQWKKILACLKCNVQFVYLLSKWFTRPEYKDTLDYINSCQCHYYFDYIPLTKFALPKEH